MAALSTKSGGVNKFVSSYPPNKYHDGKQYIHYRNCGALPMTFLYPEALLDLLGVSTTGRLSGDEAMEDASCQCARAR